MAQVVTLIGDVVGSRKAGNRADLQRRLVELLGRVGASSTSGLQMTVGDEFQGLYATIADAMEASLLLHLGGVGTARFRIGIGWGELTLESGDRAPFGQDGPAWWRARDAIEGLEDLSAPARTMVGTATLWDGMINDFLALRDALLTKLDETDSAIALGLLDGRTQRDLASELGLHESSVSRRVSGHGIGLLVSVASPTIPGFGAGQ